MTTRSRLPFALAAVLLLAGCSPEWWALGTTPGAAAPTPATTAGGGEAEGMGDEDADDGIGACPVGTWTLDNASWGAELARFWREGTGSGDVTVSGVLDLDWRSDGTYTLSAAESTYVVDGVAAGVAFTQTVRHDGDESGTWTGSGDRFVLVADGATGMTSTVTLAGAGGVQVFDQNDVVTEPWSGELVVGCAPGGMTTTVTEASGTLTVGWTRR